MQHIKHYSLCLLVVFALLLGALISAQPALAKDGTMKGNGTQESPYQIEDAKDLLAFAEEVNKPNYDEPEADINIWAKLMKDIDLNPSYTYNQSTDQWTDAEGNAVEESKLEEWAPIADDSAYPYTGTFEGNGHTISGLFINNSSTNDDYFGLFGVIGSGGNVINLTVEGSVTVNIPEKFSGDLVIAGGVTGTNRGNVNNCTNKVNVTVTNNKTIYTYVGGVSGVNYGNVSNCSNQVIITATADAAQIGGVVGQNQSDGSIEICNNTGAVNGTGQDIYTGGVAGRNYNTISKCYNTGAVSGTIAGGVAGANSSTKNSGTVTSCYNTGMVTASSEGATIGGVVGANSNGSTSGTVNGCYYLNTVAGSDIGDSSGTSENVASKTTEEFASGEVAWLLQDALGENADQVWRQDISKGGYPVLHVFDASAPEVYRVAFEYNYDYEGTENAAYTNSGGTVSAPTEPKREGYAFGGWYSDKDFNTKWNFDTDTVTEDINLYAKWTARIYPVTLITNDGTINGDVVTSYTYGVGATLPVNVIRTGYTFGGWYENSNFSGEPVKEISKTDTGNKTYYAKWLSANAGVSSVTVNGVTATLNDTTFTVTLPAGSSLPTADEIQIIPATGADITAGPTTNDGGANWTFTVTAEDGTTTATYTIQVTIALQPTYTVTVSANPAEGGTVSGGGEATEGTEVTVTATPASGYHFVRWTENDTTVSTDTSYTFNLEANRTLVAIFEQDQTPTPDPDPDDPPYTGKYSYEIVSDVGENGTIDVDRYATEGDQVTITVSPDEAYLPDDLTVTSGGKDVALTDNGDGTYTFTMPSGDVAVTATFAEDPNWEEPEDPATDVSEIFTDVPANHWAQAAIQYVYDNGLMTGVSDTAFAPEATTTRAMIVSMLARMENVTSAADAGFADVAVDDWYATAVNWAAANGIVNGISDDTFVPNDPITREQLAAMLMNYAQWKGQDTSARADLSGYSDAPSTWASEAVQWAVAEGLLAGVTDDQLQPQGQATRAQVAAIMQRFLEA